MTDTANTLCEGALFVYALRRVTEAAARAAAGWIGRGEQGEAGGAAVEAMVRELSELPFAGKVVTGEGEGGLSRGLETGTFLTSPGAKREFDVAVDPIEGMSYLARGMTNAMAVIALAPQGSLMDLGPAFYMEKFVTPPDARGKIDPGAPVEVKLQGLAQWLHKPISDLTIFVLEKPRHRELVRRIHDAGARVALYPAGAVAGAIMASIPGSGIDALMGTGGTREGLISACAIKALGGEFLGRFDPQLTTEKMAVEDAGIDTRNWFDLDTFVTTDEVYFAATGITTGLLFEGVGRENGVEKTQSLLISGPGGERQLLTTFHRV